MRNVVKLLLTISIIWMLAGCTKTDQKEVVIYTSVDQIFSETILSDFEKNTGIKVKAVYDVEASKTVGLVNRLLAEKGHPRCDVFWNSEVGRTIFLKQKGLFTPYTSPSAKDISLQFKDKDGYWTGFAARAKSQICLNRYLTLPSRNGKGKLRWGILCSAPLQHIWPPFTQPWDRKKQRSF